MIGGVEPDFRTISDFRKDNISSLKRYFMSLIEEYQEQLNEALHL